MKIEKMNINEFIVDEYIAIDKRNQKDYKEAQDLLSENNIPYRLVKVKNY